MLNLFVGLDVYTGLLLLLALAFVLFYEAINGFHDTANAVATVIYTRALWEKLGQPILTLAMILLAVPFTFSTPRSPGMGSRLAVGVIVGLLTWISYQIMVNLGLLFALSAPVTALGLPVAFVLVALILVYWYDRQH